MPTRREIIARIETPLTALYGEREARQIARIIVMELGGLCLTDLVAEPDKELGINELDRIIGELAAGRPLQYVLGHTEFYGLDFQVREGVLIPRPETEELVRWIAESPAPDNPAVLDVGTGSGCIAVTLARLIPGAVSQLSIFPKKPSPSPAKMPGGSTQKWISDKATPSGSYSPDNGNSST